MCFHLRYICIIHTLLFICCPCALGLDHLGSDVYFLPHILSLQESDWRSFKVHHRWKSNSSFPNWLCLCLVLLFYTFRRGYSFLRKRIIICKATGIDLTTPVTWNVFFNLFHYQDISSVTLNYQISILFQKLGIS